MRDLVGQQQFLLKTRQDRGVRSQFRPDDFQRDEAIKFAVGGLVNGAHTALAKQLQNLVASPEQLADLQSHVEQAVDEYKSAYPTQLKFDYVYKANEAPFDIQSIYHDDKFTYIKTNAPEKFSVYEMKDGKPNLVTYDLREGTYIIPKIMDSGYVELGKKKMEFTRKG